MDSARARRACRGDAFIGLQFFELEFELLDLPVQLLGPVAVLLALELGNQQLEVFDLDRMVAQCAVARDDHRLQSGDVVGKRGGIGLHAPQCRKRRSSLQGKRGAPGAF